MKANNATEQFVLEYFEKNASDNLKERVEAEGKTIAGALRYASEQAQKQKVGNCACVADEIVFGWIMHYFEDESATKYESKSPTATVVAGNAKKTAKKPAKKPVKTKKAIETPVAVQPVISKKESAERNAGQLFLFDMGGAK